LPEGNKQQSLLIWSKVAYSRRFVFEDVKVQMVPHSDGSTDLLAPPQKGDSKVGQCWVLQTKSGSGGGV